MSKIKISVPIFFFLVTLHFSNQLIYLFFDITQSPDFTVYSSYFDYFFNNENSVQREQGLAYYFINSSFLKFYNTYFEFNEINYLLNKSIYSSNSLIYSFGLLGYFNLLKYLRFSTKNIFITLSFLNFFPITFMLRMTLKPEILAFALIPWILLLFERYFDSKKIINLFLSIPFLGILLTSKGSILGISLIFLTIHFIKNFKFSKNRQFYYLIITLLIFFSITTYENQKSGASNIFNISSGVGENVAQDAEKYNNKASPSIIYKLNLFNLFTSPIDNVHKDSFIAITLLDSFGDYFKLYWNNNDSLFYKNRSELINVEITNEIKKPELGSNKLLTIYVQKDTDIYLRETISLLLGASFFIFLIINIFSNSKYKLFLISPLIGAFLILIHVITGFPKNNFDPTRGDSLKPFYFSFLLCLSFIFLILNYIRKNKITKYLLVPYIVIVLILFGFPKNLDYQNNLLLEKNKYSSSCMLNSLFINNEYTENYCKSSFKFNNEKEFLKYSKKLKFPIFQSIQMLSIIFIGLYLSSSSLTFNIKLLNISKRIKK